MSVRQSARATHSVTGERRSQPWPSTDRQSKSWKLKIEDFVLKLKKNSFDFMFNLESSPRSGIAARARWPLAGLSPEAETKKVAVLNWANVCSPEHTSDTSTNYDSFLNWTFTSPNMVRTVQTLLHSQLACNEMQASARTRGRRAADSMMEM